MRNPAILLISCSRLLANSVGQPHKMSTCQNGAPPMYLPWSNNSVTADQVAISRGIQITIGTPPQILSMVPSTSDANLHVANKAYCAPSYNDSCMGGYGGVFNPSASSTYHLTPKGQWNGTYDPQLTSIASIYFNDVLSFGNATSYDFPMYLYRAWYCMSYVRFFFIGTSLR